MIRKYEGKFFEGYKPAYYFKMVTQREESICGHIISGIRGLKKGYFG